MSRHTFIPVDALGDWVGHLLQALGMPAAHALEVARVLVRTSQRGIDTHGVSRLPAYLAQMEAGVLDPQAVPSIEIVHGALRVDAHRSAGQLSGVVATRAAINIAQQQVACVCSISNSGHFAALGTYLLDVAEEGMLGFLCQRTPPIMARHGSRGAAIGNNPLAFAAPVADSAPLVFDMACSVVARGHVDAAHRAGDVSIPLGWAIDADGRDTTVPELALLGAMLPMAGHKGIGLAMLVECLAGCLSGAAEVHSSGAGSVAGVEAFLLVVNPRLLNSSGGFGTRMQAWLDRYQTSVPGGRYPGMRQAQCERERANTGIPVPLDLLEALCRTSEKLDVAIPMP